MRARLRYFVTVLLASAVSIQPIPSALASRTALTAPNIVLILTDDMRFDFVRYMPVVQQELAAKGVTFSNSFVENSLCCPSRTSILTGDDSRTTRVYQNEPPFGGYPTFHDRGEESSTIATWLQGSGYHTGLVGKYLNLYGPDNTEVPPGWDRWVAFDDANAAYYDYELNVDGALGPHGEAPADYSTDTLAADAASFIQDASADQPLFLYFAPFGPHGPSTPAPRDVGTVTSGPDPYPAGVYEKNLNDKPRYVRKRKAVSEAILESRYIRTIESLGAVDDAVQTILDALSATDRLKNTMIVFTSDNGYMLGEHHLIGKQVPYEESIRVPLIVRDDALVSGPRERSQLIVNTDLAPTFADLAEVATPATDGQSFLPILEDPSAMGRAALLIEHLITPLTGVEFSDLPTYCAVRTRNWKFVHYNSGFEELYDLATDPAELHNVAGKIGYRRRTNNLRSLTRGMCSPLPPHMNPF